MTDLPEIAATVRRYKKHAREQAALAREAHQLRATARMLRQANAHKVNAQAAVVDLAEQREARLDANANKLLAMWPDMLKIAELGLPRFEDPGDILEWLMLENVPGRFPYTAGAFAVAIDGNREGEDAAVDTDRHFAVNALAPLASTLSDAFAFVDARMARGMSIDEAAANLSLVFAGGMGADDAALARAARRIWAVAMRDRYGGAERSQKLGCRVPGKPADPGSFVVAQLTELAEERVLSAFERHGLSSRP